MRGSPHLGRRTGLALILVLTVIMALVIIATPFVLSMIMQEKTAVAERARRQAGYGAEGVRNFAASQLFRGADGLERATGGTPYMDEPAEFQIEMRDARLKDLKVLDPHGSLWGVTAQDEQGKINVMTAPDRPCVTIRGILDPKVVDLKDVLTIYSGRPARWVRPQKIREIGIIQNPADPGMVIKGVLVDNALNLGIGAKIHVIKPGRPPFETTVTRNGLYIIGLPAVETNPPIGGDYLNGLLEVEMRHPVNINTARREVLTALHDGLSISIPQGTGATAKTYTLTSEDARRVADGLYQKKLSTWHEFLIQVLMLDVDDLAKAAVIINAIDPTNLILTNGAEGRGTLPICFTSNETITVEAFSTMNTPAGTPQGGAGFREVVDLGCPMILTRSWENQFDFDRMMGPPRLLVTTTGVAPKLPKWVEEGLATSGLTSGGYLGYPFGSRMETFPKDIDKYEASDMTLKSAQGLNQNFVSMRTERDYRGVGGLLYKIEHFDEEMDGHKIEAKSYDKEHKEVFAPMPGRPDIAAGGTEFWIRFDSAVSPASKISLFDIRETDEINRISIELFENEIIYRITDASQGGNTSIPNDKGWAEIKARFSPVKDTWYHIAAYWKGTRYGHMLLMIDGFVPAKAKWRFVDSDDQNVAQSTELASVMPAPADPADPFTIVPLKDSQFLQKPPNWPRDTPWVVPIRVGDEVIDIDTSTGQGRRGSRKADTVYGPAYYDHPQNAKATLFGYTSPLHKLNVRIQFDPPQWDPPGTINMEFGQIYTTRGAIQLKFGMPDWTSLVGEDSDPSGNLVLAANTNRIKYVIPDTSPVDNTEWPDSGYIKIEDEAIYYQRITREGIKTGYFEVCSRGQEGTMPLVHQGGVAITLWSIAVTEPDTNLPSPTIIQFNEEWFGPVKVASVPPGGPADHFWVGVTVNSKAVPFARGIRWRTPVARWHEAGERLIPIFSAREMDPTVLRTNLQKYDTVTAIDSTNYREQHMVCNSITIEELNEWIYQTNPGSQRPPPPPKDVKDQGIQLASFFDGVKRDFKVDDLHNRILKWPSGELLGERFLEIMNPPVKYGPAKATIDEVKNIASTKGNFQLNMVAEPETPQLNVGIVGNLNVSTATPSGVLLVGEELVGFADSRNGDTLTNCKRGWLNSVKEVHDRGDAFFLLNFLPVAAVKHSPISTESRTIQMSQVLQGQGFFHGYVLIDDEVVGFEKLGIKGVELDTLARWDGNGLFRGMFGTSAAAHQPNAMIFAIPFRYWDGYKEGQFDDKMPYFQVAHTTRNARWRGISAQIELPAGEKNLLPHCYVRLDGLGDFTLPKVDDHSAVWHFYKSQTNPLEDMISSRLENGQMELRFFLEYKPGSYWPEHSWKRTMKFMETRLEYDRDTKVLLHEDK